MKTSSPRFEVLDALRGLCAILVVFFHLPVSSHFHALPLTRHGYLFVDFFFVLSGFVIAHAYSHRLKTLGDAGTFMIRRIGRVWPLHVVILGAYVLLELSRLWFHIDAATPFVRDRAPEYLISNLLLIQAFNIHPYLTWNGPAWSISVEMGCYVLFAAMVLFAPRRFLPLAVVLGVTGALIVLTNAPRYMNTTFDFGFPRAAWGFLLGCVVQKLWTLRPAPGAAVRWLEPLCLVAAIAYVSLARGPWTVAAPLVFAACIWVFASEAGTVSRWLSARPLLKLGHWSYSIYMTHMLVITIMLIIARKLDIMPDKRRIDFGSIWANDLFALVVLAAIVALSAVTYRWIETPGRHWVNSWVKRRDARRKALAVPDGAMGTGTP